MQQFSREIHTCRCFFYSLGIPVVLRYKGSTIFRMPEDIKTAFSVTGDDSLSPERFQSESSSDTADYGRNPQVQYLVSPAEEHFIALNVGDGLSVYSGPFLTEPATPALISGLVRSGIIKMRNRTEIQDYFSSLPVISIRRFYYLGKLLELLFVSESVRTVDEESLPVHNAAIVSSAETVSPSVRMIPDSYFIKAQDYKAQLFFHSPYMVEQEICHFISAGDTEGALQVLSEINSRPKAQLAGNAVRSTKNSMICSCTFMARAAIDGGVSPDEAFTLSDTYIQGIETCNDINRILNFEEEMVRGYTAAVKALATKGRHKTITQAIDYINSHLCEELTATLIAEAVFLNPNYLSGLFLKETGETLHSFIVRRRIEDASFFVRSTAEPFADIASFYRFCSQSHFTRCFKAIMGTTPGKYRNG